MKFGNSGIVLVLMLSTGLFAEANPLAEAKRFTRGVPTNQPGLTYNPCLYQSAVIPADQQRGITLNDTGNNASLYNNLPIAQLPWFCRIQRDTRYHIGLDGSNNLAYNPIENPIAAFGGSGGGTPLYINRDYRFGAFAGFRNYANAQNPMRGTFRIRAYLASALSSGQNPVSPADETTFEMPWPGDGNWDAFLQNGATKTVTFHGLTTTVQIVGGAVQTGTSGQWNTWDDPYVVTHRASSTDYYFVVEYKGWTNAGVDPIVTTGFPATQNTAGFSPLYALDFTTPQAWQSTLVQSPQFTGDPVPSWYYGKSLQELQGAWGFAPGTPPLAMKNDKGIAYLDGYSPELRSHPILDDFVASLGSDPIALANYVSNEIGLTDPVSYNEGGSLSETSINCGGLNRGALATYLEGQGNPWEQCALLVYLLRKADVPAVYCEPAHNTLGMLDTQLSKLLRMQIRGAQTMDGNTPMPTIVPTNYPWVSAWIASENRWVNIFPWLKDTEVSEGGNLYDQFPTGTKSGSAWVRKYLQGDNTIVPEQTAVYQQEPADAGHPNGLIVVEAEGFHEQVPKGGKRWEPLAEVDENGNASPTGYSGTSWMRAMPNTGTNITSNLATTSPRLDYQVNFTRSGTHYVWVRGQGTGGNDRSVHVGLDGVEVSSASNLGSLGSSFGWRNKNSNGTVRKIDNVTAGTHTINVWMREDGFRFDKLLLTGNSTYDPANVASGNGPAISKQSAVEPNVPSNLFPRYARQNLGANTSFDDLGMKFRDRIYYRTQWDEFPRPFQLQSGSHVFYERLDDRPNTFDTVQVKLWSDRNANGLYDSGTDGLPLDTGEWLSTDLHGRRFYASCRKLTGNNTHQLRLYLAPYRSGNGTTGTGNFSVSNKLQEQLLTGNLTSSDDKLQFEITHKRHKRWQVGVYSLGVTNQGSGYTGTPSVSISAPPAGSNNRAALASAVVSGGKVTSLNLIDPGSGYTSVPTVTIAAPGGGGATAQATAVLEDPSQRWMNPLGVSVSQLITQKPQIRKGELAAICLNFGRVSERMMRVQAEDFWQWERDLQGNSTLSTNADFQEKTQSTSAYLMGLGYYNRVSQFKETNERLHKTRILSMFAAGLSKLAPYRDPATANSGPTFGLPNNGEIIPRQATVDMFFLNAGYASNASAHADSGLPFNEATKDFWQLLIAEISAQEHAIINDYYKESAAISTVKLLHRTHDLHSSNGTQSDILRLTKANYVSLGGQTYTYGSVGKTLSGTSSNSTWDPSMWTAISSAFSAAGGDYAEVFITPGPVASASASYTGMGALVFSNDAYSALISGDMNLANGGSGSSFSTPYYSPSQLSNVTLVTSPGGYSINYRPPITSYNPVVAPASTGTWSYGTTANLLNTGAYTATTYQSSSWVNNASLYGLTLTGNLGDYYTATASRGSTGSPSFFGSVGSTISNLGGWVSDPVHVVTGEFYIDATDLTLPGPFPLQIRRNYSSQALSDNDFGQGWKLAYFPYLVLGDNDLIYGAEMDGSVIAYRKDAQNASLYAPLPADNPSLKNLHNGGAGASANVLNNRITKSGTTYTLDGPNGQTRTFVVQSFPVGTITRSRPYLNTWRDANGNTLTFTFNNDNTKSDYGLLKRVTANNGNFAAFSYDVYGHIVEAWTGDGRRVKYTYDAQGDLRTVLQPDGAEHKYDYQQETTTAGGDSVQNSTHLLIRETKPNGRILENDYDSLRRVTQQRAVVGDSPAPVVNATFIYGTGNTQNATTKTWTGNTTVKDAYDRATVFSYTNSLITSEDDPETPPEVRDWYPADAVPGSNGAYPRSLKQITDRRGVVTFFKYDSRGNLVSKSVGTPANPADLDGDGTATSGELAETTWTYTSLNLPETQTDPTGVVTKWFYDQSAAYPYLATRIEKWAQGTLVSKTARAFTNQGTSAYGLLQSERSAADSADEAETTWLYDSHGYPSKQTRLTGTSDPSVVTDMVYNLRGELVQETDTLGRKSTYGYDAQGRRTLSERRDGGNLVAWDYTYYNLNGEPEWSDGSRYNPEDYVWRKYDGNGRLAEELRWRSQANAGGTGVEAPSGDALMSTSLSKYDLYNNLVEVRDPRRHSTSMDYDFIGRLKRRDFYDGIKGGGGVLKASEYFQYEPGGQISQQTSVLGGVTTLLYNARGQLRKRTNADSSVEEWRYDADGRVVQEILRNGNAWHTTYNDLTRVVTRQLLAGGTPVKTEIKAYDRRGNCISETLDGQTFTKSYDGLNRPKTVTGPASTATSDQQIATYSYPDGAGRQEVVVNGLNETTTTLRDALGRVESVEVRDAGNALVRRTSYTYSPDHHQVTVTDGTGPGAIVTRSWTDTFGKTVLSQKADDTAEFFFYDGGGLLTDHVDRAGRQTHYIRNWRGDITQETRPGGVVVDYVPDVAGNILQRNMPGGLSEQMQYDTAGRLEWSKLVQGGGTTRRIDYAYFPANHAWAGLLNTATDARGIVSTYGYDPALRVANVNQSGTGAVSRSFSYNERDQATSITETGPGGTTLVSRFFDGYGSLSSESVTAGAIQQSALTQYFDAAGRRWKLTGAGADRSFSYRADGLMTGTTVGNSTYSSTFANNGLLTGRSNPFRSVTVQNRDNRGRITDLRTNVGGVLALKETVSQWWAEDKIFGLYSERAGTGSWNEYRDYQYDISGRLIYEEFNPIAGFGEDKLYTTFDGATTWPGATGGVGVRTRVNRNSDGADVHAVPSVAAFARVTGEEVGGSQPRSVPLAGTALGADKVALNLDGRDLPQVTYPGWMDLQGNWSAEAFLAPGLHYLTATATHPSGWVAPQTASFFQVGVRAETVTDGFDDMGNLTSRAWSGGKNQTLTWDGKGRLIQVVQIGVTPFTWTALYDGLDRRISTTYTPDGGSGITANSVFDPQVEFLELGLSIGGQANWKVYGPDFSGVYGGLQGLGGLEAVIGSDGITRGIVNDWFGNATGYVALPGSGMTWSSAQFLASGPAPGWSTPPLDGTKPLHQVLGYRGVALDPTGYIHQGLRDYDSAVGRWLSPDSLGHSASLSLYDYCDNDPLNVYDPDGRFGKGVSSGWSGSINSNAPNSSAFSAGMMFGGFTQGYTSGLGQGYQNVSGYTSYQSHLTMFDGDHYAAANAAWNPAYMAMRGFTEAGGGMGMQPQNLGLTLTAGERVWSGVEGGLGTVGTVGVGFSGAALTRSVGLTSPRLAPTTLAGPFPGNPSRGLPLGTMDDVSARSWYLNQLDAIPTQIDQTQSLRNQAWQAFELRNQARVDGRALMADRVRALGYDVTDPIRSWSQQIKYASEVRGKTGSEIWEYILDSSTRSRPSVNAAAGLAR